MLKVTTIALHKESLGDRKMVREWIKPLFRVDVLRYCNPWIHVLINCSKITCGKGGMNGSVTVIRSLHTVWKFYPDDIFNMDETGLFYQQ